MISRINVLYYFKCPVFKKSNETCKETGKCVLFTRKKRQSIEIIFEEAQILDLLEQDFKSVTIKIDCSNTLRNAEVFGLLSDEEFGKVQEEAGRRKVYDNPSLYKIAHELYSAMYKEKLKCGTKTIVE